MTAAGEGGADRRRQLFDAANVGMTAECRRDIVIAGVAKPCAGDTAVADGQLLECCDAPQLRLFITTATIGRL